MMLMCHTIHVGTQYLLPDMYCKLPRITLLLQCDPILHIFSYLMEHSPNVLFSVGTKIRAIDFR